MPDARQPESHGMKKSSNLSGWCQICFLHLNITAFLYLPDILSDIIAVIIFQMGKTITSSE